MRVSVRACVCINAKPHNKMIAQRPRQRRTNTSNMSHSLTNLCVELCVLWGRAEKVRTKLSAQTNELR